MKRSPRWARALLRCVARRSDVDAVLGDLEERRFTMFETLEMAAALVRGRLSGFINACVEPARRALRIHPTDALKEA